jgi:hypothetical protein
MFPLFLKINLELIVIKPLQKLLAVIALLALSTSAFAHHSGAMFDATKEHTLVGVVKEFIWANPHCSFKVEVTDAAGKSEIWAVEMNGPQNMMHQGWKRSTLKMGDKITAVVRPLRDGKPGGLYVSVTLADGTVLKGNSTQNDYPASPQK